MAKYSIGIYIRLSLADIDLSKREGKTEKNKGDIRNLSYAASI